ncbi:MAG: hypothetical protein ACRDNM_06200 [Gaiellaceae bacterium]
MIEMAGGITFAQTPTRLDGGPITTHIVDGLPLVTATKIAVEPWGFIDHVLISFPDGLQPNMNVANRFTLYVACNAAVHVYPIVRDLAPMS